MFLTTAQKYGNDSVAKMYGVSSSHGEPRKGAYSGEVPDAKGAVLWTLCYLWAQP